MTTPKNAQSRGGNKRLYTWRTENYWSVTTIIGNGLPKPALLPWGIKMVATGAIVNADVVAAMVAKCVTAEQCAETLRNDAKPSPCEHCDQAIRYLKGLPYAARDRAGDFGSEMHRATEAYILGKPFPAWSPLVKPRMAAFEKWLADYEPEFGATEVSVYNRSEHYAGTLDGFMTIGGRKLIGDYKSSKALYPEVGLQLAAYRFAEFMGLPDGSESVMPEVDGCVALRLDADGSYEFIDVRADREVFKHFLYCRENFRWLEETSKGVLVGPVGHRLGDADLALANTLNAKDAA